MTAYPAPRNAAEFIDGLVRDHLHIVHYVARELAARLPGHIDFDDLVSAGNAGLVQAAQSYDPNCGVPFKSWANTRIRGAILDDMRRMDWATRGVRSRQRTIRQTEENLAASLGRYPTAEEIARNMGVEVEQLRRDQVATERAVLSLDASDSVIAETLPDTARTPAEHAEVSEQWERIRAAIAKLPERLRTVVTAVYVEQRPMTELAEEFGVTESRISQIRSEAIKALREALNDEQAVAAAGIPLQRTAPTKKDTVKVGRRRFFTGK